MAEVSVIGGEIIPAKSGATIASVKSDTVELAKGPCRAIHCNTAGNIVGILEDDSATLTFTLIAGLTYSYAFKHIYSTSTTATGIVLW